MAAYCWVDGLVTCVLMASTMGSAQGPTLGNEYGKNFTSTFTLSYTRHKTYLCTKSQIIPIIDNPSL